MGPKNYLCCPKELLTLPGPTSFKLPFLRSSDLQHKPGTGCNLRDCMGISYLQLTDYSL